MMEPEQGVPLSSILNAISAHMSSLGAQVAVLEESVSPGMAQDHNLSEELIYELQALDRVRQSVLDLATLTYHLSEKAKHGSVSPDQIDAIGKVLHLQTTQSLLTGEPEDTSALGNKAEPSEVLLF